MDELDGRILKLLQNEFPLSERPYEVLASKLGISCDVLLGRVRKLIDDGVIRRMGASFDSCELGFCSTLAAVSVKDELVDRAVEIINRFDEVTHNYLRRDEFNIWFTIVAADGGRIEHIIEQIRSELTLDSSEILVLPAKGMFKLNTCFNVSV
ncbi:MAG: AsnC family transcriptional regulator [Planctomycetes bacterium]|nr:AsnC family transcriptional regulator [Planctomycetota bacterium]